VHVFNEQHIVRLYYRDVTLWTSVVVFTLHRLD